MKITTPLKSVGWLGSPFYRVGGREMEEGAIRLIAKEQGRCRGCRAYVLREPGQTGHVKQHPIDGDIEECGPVDCPSDVARLAQENTRLRNALIAIGEEVNALDA